ncbi:hypothetical protein ACHQM5_021462 [Ranunculus cassubicifolius]
MEKLFLCFGFSLKNKTVKATDILSNGSVSQPDSTNTISPVEDKLSIPPNSPWRGSAANFPQPVSEEDKRAAQYLVETVYKFNCSSHEVASPLPEIVYRSSSGEEDILRHVFRWDLNPYEDVFQNGICVNRQQDTLDSVYYNLHHYVHHGGRPLDSRKPATHAFISTTVNTSWHLSLKPDISIDVYRYEIYAPGGIWVAHTLGDRYQYPSQDEVCFVAGIAPQYIRSAQCFRLSTVGTRSTKRERVDNTIRLNGNFHPQSHMSKLLYIQKPIFDCLDEKNRRVPLKPDFCQPNANSHSGPNNWYAGKVANFESYINAAFRSSRINEAYLFMKNEYVILNYAPGTTNDKVLTGPNFICNGYLSLAGTSFAEHGIDCAFGSHDKDEAFLFSGNLCVHINFIPHTTTDKIINGPMSIDAMFPFLKGTVFENGIDAAFESTTRYEVNLFKNNQHARINYNGTESRLRNVICPITQAFPSLKNTFFESGIDSAFASHRTGEAYLFKEDFYALFYFGSDATDDRLISSVKKLLPNWPSLRSILPRQNRGLDVHDHTKHDVHRVQDEV